MSSNEFDAFEDIRFSQTGIFDAGQAALEPGLKKHETVAARVRPEGVVMELSCQGCGKPTKLTVEWPEMVALKYGVNPVVAFQGTNIIKDPMRWEYKPAEGAWRPDCRCPLGCGFWIPLRLFPDEPEKYLQAARRGGIINPAGEAQISQVAMRAAAAGQAVRR